MKTKEYVKKYKLDENDRFNHNHFIQDLTIDFMSLLEVGKAKESFKGFENAVRAIRMKWDGVNKKTVGQLPEKLWKYFYATVVVPLRNELFPEVMERKAKENAERRARREEYRRFEKEQEERFNRWSWEIWFASMLKVFKNMQVPHSSFEKLGLTSECSKEDVQKKFRELSMQHHPDMGGKADVFSDIVEAKNKCLSYLQSKGG